MTEVLDILKKIVNNKKPIKTKTNPPSVLWFNFVLRMGADASLGKVIEINPPNKTSDSTSLVSGLRVVLAWVNANPGRHSEIKRMILRFRPQTEFSEDDSLVIVTKKDGSQEECPIAEFAAGMIRLRIEGISDPSLKGRKIA